ncbi:glycoside hydrolase family 5 protein [Gautieria morchelliformis]|nr:glycoside hydrolase family 5 protein [Gautieria morchelliformis]
MSSLAASFVVLESTHESVDTDYKPGSSLGAAHDWSNAALRVQGRHFVDKYGRICGLRGVNLSGNCKSPTNHDDETFPANPELATFVDRPFPLEDAPEHFARLRRWGLTFVRFIVTWEALAPASPTEFSTPFLNYLRALLSLLPQYGLTAFVSLHQDVWSRYSGGSGAPAWTLTSVGFSLDALEECGAAWLKGVTGGGHTEEERGLWPAGYQKLAASTMATCFWAGDTFASKLKVPDPTGTGEIPIQKMLQDAFLEAWGALANAVGDLEGVLGFEMLNEPHRGYIELESLHAFDYNTDLHLREIPSALAGFTLGAGHPTLVPFYSRSFPMPTTLSHDVLLNEKGRKVWREDGPTKGRCPWEMQGVWGWDPDKQKGVVLRESYFKKHPQTGEKIDWYRDFYYPFLARWVERVRSVPGARDKIVFVEAIPNEFCPRSWTEEHQFDNMVYAPHWYDLNGLFQKAFKNMTYNVQGLSRGMFVARAMYWGHASARDNFALQLGTIAREGYKSLGERPVIIGECGIPMDLNHKEAFHTGDFTWQSKMMDAVITGLERSLLGYTLWNYNPDNDDVHGDSWCGENFSWFGTAHRRSATPFPSLSALKSNSGVFQALDQSNPDLDDGGRILRTVVRPYPAKVAGVPLRWAYELNTGQADFEWQEIKSEDLRCRETEIFYPAMLLTGGRTVHVDGLARDAWKYDIKRQTLFILPPITSSAVGTTRHVVVRADPPLEPLFTMTTHWQDFAKWYAGAGALVLAIVGFLFKVVLADG